MCAEAVLHCLQAHLVYISQAELEDLVCEDAAGISKAEQGVIREDDLYKSSAHQPMCVLTEPVAGGTPLRMPYASLNSCMPAMRCSCVCIHCAFHLACWLCLCWDVQNGPILGV